MLLIATFGAYFAWNALVSRVAPPVGGQDVARIVANVAALLLWLWVPSLRRSKLVAPALAVVAGISTIALFLPSAGVQVPDSVLVTSQLIGHVGVYALQFIVWSSLFASVPIAEAGVGLGAAYVFGAALYAAVSVLPAQFGPGIALCIPFAALPCLMLGLERSGGTGAQGFADATSSRHPSLPVPWKLVLVMSCLWFACGINRTYSTAGVDLASAAFAGAVVATATFAFGHRFSVFTTYRALFVVIVAALAIGTVLGGESVLSQVLINMCQAFANILLFLYLSDRSYRFGVPVVPLIATARACTSATAWFGGALASAMAEASGVSQSAVLYSVSLVAVAASAFLWLSGDGTFVGAMESVGEAALPTRSSRDGDALRACCADLATQYHLSAREQEVLVLLARGMSAKDVERELVLSANTVKTHVRHVYQKLGIHSRSELEALLRNS